MKKKKDEKQLLFPLKEAAKILGVSFTFLDLRTRGWKGPIETVTMGNRRYIHKDTLQKLAKTGIK
jgi:hypothetical protein